MQLPQWSCILLSVWNLNPDHNSRHASFRYEVGIVDTSFVIFTTLFYLQNPMSSGSDHERNQNVKALKLNNAYLTLVWLPIIVKCYKLWTVQKRNEIKRQNCQKFFFNFNHMMDLKLKLLLQVQYKINAKGKNVVTVIWNNRNLYPNVHIK